MSRSALDRPGLLRRSCHSDAYGAAGPAPLRSCRRVDGEATIHRDGDAMHTGYELLRANGETVSAGCYIVVLEC